MTPPDVNRARFAPRAPVTSSPSALVLIAANLVPLAGVVFFGWSVFATLLLFWVENVVVGAFNALRMVSAQPTNRAVWATKLWLVPFFLFHYGMFTTVHGVFVLAMFGGSIFDAGFPGPGTFVGAVRAAGIWPAALALVASHGVSFAVNYLGAGEYRTADLVSLLWRPYGRVMLLHGVILGGGVLVQKLGASVAALALLVVLKTVLDLSGHVREHGVR